MGKRERVQCKLELNIMELEEINDKLPGMVVNQLMSSEKAYYFSYIPFEGGCGSSGEKEKYWIVLTDKRVMYKTEILEGIGDSQESVIKDGDLPFNKISFIEISEGKKFNDIQLRISSSGGTIIIPIPTKEKGYEIRKMYSELSKEL